MPAITSMTHYPAINALAQRLLTRDKASKQIVCAAIRKLLHIAYGVLKWSKPSDVQKARAR